MNSKYINAYEIQPWSSTISYIYYTNGVVCTLPFLQCSCIAIHNPINSSQRFDYVFRALTWHEMATGKSSSVFSAEVMILSVEFCRRSYSPTTYLLAPVVASSLDLFFCLHANFNVRQERLPLRTGRILSVSGSTTLTSRWKLYWPRW